MYELGELINYLNILKIKFKKFNFIVGKYILYLCNIGYKFWIF